MDDQQDEQGRSAAQYVLRQRISYVRNLGRPRSVVYKQESPRDECRRVDSRAMSLKYDLVVHPTHLVISPSGRISMLFPPHFCPRSIPAFFPKLISSILTRRSLTSDTDYRPLSTAAAHTAAVLPTTPGRLRVFSSLRLQKCSRLARRRGAVFYIRMLYSEQNLVNSF